jgi:hypothetical protein
MQASFPTQSDSHREAQHTAALGQQPWLSSAGWDCIWIISPAFISTAFVILSRQQMDASQNIPLWVWVCFVLLVDVAHVYATLFRTYLSPQAFEKNKTLLLAMPAVAWIGGSLIYSLDGIYFWRALAYLAVFHFIRQQFGFVVFYSRHDPKPMKKYKWLDSSAVYMATIYPILFWHSNMPRNFSWFVAGDFVEAKPDFFAAINFTGIAFAVYLIVMASYIIKEFVMLKKTRFFNVPRNLLIAGTALSWWTGIITFNSDMAFTITNVVSHGIPYMALVWLYHHEGKRETQPVVKNFSHALLSNVLFFFAFLALLAYLEEGLWDGLIWREHLNIFAWFSALPTINDPAILALLIPFLALPQSTHYLLDGYIWRVKDRSSIWSA